MGARYEFGHPDSERRVFIDRNEIRELAVRARAWATTIDAFAEVDDRGDGPLRSELLRQERELSARAIAVLS